DHIAFEVDSREDWLRALEHVRACGVEIVSGPYVHAPEGGDRFIGGSGSHAFYFLDPDGNRIGIYCWMVKVTGPSMAAPHPDPWRLSVRSAAEAVGAHDGNLDHRRLGREPGSLGGGDERRR